MRFSLNSWQKKSLSLFWIFLAIFSYGKFDLQFLKYEIKNTTYTQQVLRGQVTNLYLLTAPGRTLDKYSLTQNVFNSYKTHVGFTPTYKEPAAKDKILAFAEPTLEEESSLNMEKNKYVYVYIIINLISNMKEVNMVLW